MGKDKKKKRKVRKIFKEDEYPMTQIHFDTKSLSNSSIFDNTKRELNVPHKQWKVLQAWLKYQKGSLIQDCFHFLTPEEREFMLTGMTPAEQVRFYNELETSMGSVE